MTPEPHQIPDRSRAKLQTHAERSYVARKVLLPVQAFIHTEGRSSLFLLLGTLAALVWANSEWAELYRRLWESRIAIDLQLISLSKDLRHWINDGLMAVFFFVVGLEIKRELVHGQLSDRYRAALPVAAALGGMIIPAALFLAFNAGTETAEGWGIPMATDIAFALGVLALAGRRIPSEVRTFLLAVAVVDDVGAILVIALFYTGAVAVTPLLWALLLIALILGMQRAGVHQVGAYAVPAILLWLAVLQSGVHATIAGVLLAALTPAEAPFSAARFAESADNLLEQLRDALARGDANRLDGVLGAFEELSIQTESPVERLERRLHPWTSYIVLPLFAFANAGVSLEPETFGRAVREPVTLGIILGLLLGKPLGIVAFSWMSIRLGLARLPRGVSWRPIVGAGIVAGIGFTVSLFIADLAYEGSDVVEYAKIGILIASFAAALGGYVFLTAGARARKSRTLT